MQYRSSSTIWAMTRTCPSTRRSRRTRSSVSIEWRPHVDTLPPAGKATSVGEMGWEHLVDQAGQDWYYVVLIVAGFGIQVAIMSEVRRRHRLHHRCRRYRRCGSQRLDRGGGRGGP